MTGGETISVARQDPSLQTYLNQSSDLMRHEGLLRPEETADAGHSVKAPLRNARNTSVLAHVRVPGGA